MAETPLLFNFPYPPPFFLYGLLNFILFLPYSSIYDIKELSRERKGATP